MKLITLNIEGSRHIDKVEDFIISEMPDILCLQECRQDIIEILEGLKYNVHFLPVTIKSSGHDSVESGNILASLLPIETQKHYYFEPTKDLISFNVDSKQETSKQGFIFGTIINGTEQYHIASNHFTWTPNGDEPNQYQKNDMESFLEIVETIPPHVMCGDFNIPRHQNYLYKNLTSVYTDCIPEEYNSSLDRSLHKLGDNPEKNNLFTEYMVDYIFTQGSYKASDVRLEFGISDHAAVVANISKT